MADLGIYHYNTRFYDLGLGRFLSADTMLPGAGNTQSYDRYSYVQNSPLKLVDPTGHFGQIPCIPGATCPGDVIWSYPNNDFESFFELGTDLLCGVTQSCHVDIEQNQVIADPPQLSVIFADVTFPSLESVIKPVQKYEVGTYEDLGDRSVVGDGIQRHHAPQYQAAQQVIPGYNYQTGPAIALPNEDHFLLASSNLQGPYNGTPQDLLQKTLDDLRSLQNIPSESIQNLKDLWKQTWPKIDMRNIQ